jgi:hypothetical protein
MGRHPPQEGEPEGIDASIDARDEYELGEPVTLTVQVTYSGDEALQVLTWGTPLEGRITADYFTVQRDGEGVPYDGPFVKRGDPPIEAYVLVEPGRPVSGTVDISTAYAIDRVGDYTVTLRATALDAFTVPGALQPPRERHDHVPRQLPEVSAHFHVTGGGVPKPTAGHVVRAAESRPQGDARAPEFNGGTAAHRADTVAAHYSARAVAALAAEQLNAGPAAARTLYQTWFGGFERARYDTVGGHFRDIANTLVTEPVRYDLTGRSPAGDVCEPGFFAFTYRGVRTVWLCGGYLSAPETGTDCKYGTLVHEWSHAISGTEDIAYGEDKCRELAFADPGQAGNNADSHEYFVENTRSVTPAVDLRPDDVAQNVAGANTVTFVGYLSAGEGNVWYLWNSWFQARLELSRNQILHQIPGDARSDGRSVIWVRSDARIAKCELGSARQFAGEFATSEDEPEEDPHPPVPFPKRYPKY